MKKLAWIWMLCLILLTGCGHTTEPVQETFFAMDTTMNFAIYGDPSLLTESQALIAELEAQVSVTDPDSELSIINRNSTGTLTGQAAQLMQRALSLCDRTEGALDLSIYPIVRAWGFTTDCYQVPQAETLQTLLLLVDYRQIQYEDSTVTLSQGMEIDLGSVAKGFAGQQTAEYLRTHGVSSALLSLGGNVQTIGSKPDGTPWQIGVQDPGGDTPMLVLSIQDQAVVTSGGYERYFEQDGVTYWHIMDPDTGYPADSGLLSVTVVGDDGLLCDGLSTALFVMGLERASSFWAEHGQFEAVFVTKDGTVYLTEGLQTQIALTEDHADTVLRVITR